MRGRRAILVLAALALAGSACGTSGGKDSAAEVFAASPSSSALTKAGWMARAVTGMPKTVAGVRQVAYLETTDPHGHQIDLQFLESGSNAKKEQQAIRHKYPDFMVDAVGNVLVFCHPDGKESVPQSALAFLKGGLRSQ